MSDHKREIDVLRQEIARIDGELLGALERRARAARGIGERRKDEPAALPLAERASVHALIDGASGEMPAESLREIFREVLAACIALEMPAKVVYLGPENGPGHLLARSHFGASATYIAAESTALALEEVVRHRASYALLPYETQAEGPVHATIAALASSDLRIVAVIEASTNRTERMRYAIVGTRPSSKTGEDATGVVFSVRDTPGALLDVLKSFAERSINMTKIQSRPVEADGWSYLFFVEVAGHATDRALITAFEDVKRLTKFFKVLGSYPVR